MNMNAMHKPYTLNSFHLISLTNNDAYTQAGKWLDKNLTPFIFYFFSLTFCTYKGTYFNISNVEIYDRKLKTLTICTYEGT